MGQALSSSQDTPEGGNSTRPLTYPFSLHRPRHVADETDDGPTTRPTPWRRRSSLMLNRLRRSRSSVISSPPTEDIIPQQSSNRRFRLMQRAQSSISTGIPNVFRRRTEDQIRDSTSSLLLSTSHPAPRPSLRHTLSAPTDLDAPPSPVSVPPLDFDETELQLQELASISRRRSTVRPSSMLADRLSSLRPERLTRTMSNSLRRRRPASSRGDERIPVLSQILSAAAEATAASLMGDDPNAVRNARGIGGDEGTLESFLESLQNGRMASALNRTAGTADGDDAAASSQGVNFVRLFRFGTPTPASRNNDSRASSSSGNSGRNNEQGDGENPTSEGRMVPIIIVGIRSISPNSNSQDDHIPSLFDAITGFPDPVTPPELPSESGPRLTPTRFSHRRRSLGGLASYDSQRHQRISESPRPFSSTSETSSGPRPPPSTPASAGLSAFPSGATTPTQTLPSSFGTGSAVPSRRGSLGRSTSILESGLDESTTVPQRNPRQRRLSESNLTTRWGSGSSRRNGVVEPDEADNNNSRSWIIYVLGGSYPENHPLLNTPSLFTDQPTYEDMLLLSSLIGPAKPPVASEDDVASAPGLFTLQKGEYPGSLIGTSVDTDEIIVLAAEERCLVCLCDFEQAEEARKLVQCGHIFHKDCIDQWLTTGRNSCPLCRGEGVKKSPEDMPGLESPAERVRSS